MTTTGDDLVLAVCAGWMLREFADRWLRPLPLFVSRSREPKVKLALRHLYLSTACYHERHPECPRGCQFCPSLCVCVCHWGQEVVKA